MQAPAKRSQNIVGNHVATCWELKIELVHMPIVAQTWPNDYSIMQHPQMLHEKFDHIQIWANNIQHVTTCRNREAKRTQHVASNNVAICCMEMLGSFAWGLKHIHTYTWKCITVSENHNQSNHFDQSHRTQTIQWTNQNWNKLHVADHDMKHRKTWATSDWMQSGKSHIPLKWKTNPNVNRFQCSRVKTSLCLSYSP